MKFIPLFIFILSSLTPLSSLADDAPQWYLNALKSYEKNNYQQAVYWYKQGAEQDYAIAQFSLGVIYDKGEGVTQSFEKAVYWYKQAAEQGHAAAQYNLGVRYDNGEGVTQSFGQAVYWYKQAAEHGYAPAQHSLGIMYQIGEGVTQNFEQAVYWYKKAAEQGETAAQFNLGLRYNNGEGVIQSFMQAVHWYTKAAEQGSINAQFNLAMMYQIGEGVIQSFEQAVHWYNKAAEQGNAAAQYNLGLLHNNGEGVIQSFKQAVHWYKQAAEQGYTLAQYNLGVAYDNGEGVTQSFEQGVHWYKQAAEQGFAAAQYNLGVRYNNGEGVTQSFEQAVHWYKQAAEQGDAAAQYNLGLRYDNGEGVTQSFVQAVQWYKQAAVQGYASAQYNLGVRYNNGEGVTQSFVQAVHWYKKAAVQGHVEAQLNLGNSFYEGEGVTQSFEQAVHWYKQAAMQGDAAAQYNLGNSFYEGEGVTQSFKQAVYWYKKAAEQGDAMAQFNLGVIYVNGEGDTQSFEQAARWYKQAAEQGYAAAQFNLGVMYDDGKGVTQSFEQAVHWYTQAAEQGYVAAQFNLGIRYDNGEGVTQNFEQAVLWYKEAAENGEPAAQFNLGLRYNNGEGVPQSFEQGVYWYKKSAVQGYAAAQFNLGNSFNYGEGVTQSFEKAVYWYKQAAEQGHINAQYNLGVRYDNGEGVTQSFVQAVHWYKEAAKQYYALAQYNLGVMYYHGQGVVQSNEQAFYWYKKAAEQGDASSQFLVASSYADGLGIPRDLELSMYWAEKAASQKHTESLIFLASLYMFKSELIKSEKAFELFIESIDHESEDSVEYYDKYLVQYIRLLIKQNKLEKANNLVGFHFTQLDKFEKNTYKAHYNKFVIYNSMNKLEPSRVSLLKAISLAPTADIQLELSSQYEQYFDLIAANNSRKIRAPQSKFTVSFEAQLNYYLYKFEGDFDEKDLDKLQTLVNSPEIITRSDGSALLYALESLVNHFEYIGDFKKSAFYARKALENLKKGNFFDLYVEKKLRFQNIAAFEDSFEKALAFAKIYSKLNFSANNIYSDPELDKKILMGNTFFKFGHTDQARDIYEQALTLFLVGIKKYGTCDDYFRLDINFISELWSSVEFLNLILSFNNTIDIATANHGKKFVTDSCKNNLISFNDILLKNSENLQFSASEQLLNLIIKNHQRLELQTRQKNIDSAIKINISKSSPVHYQLKNYYDAQVEYEKIIANYHLEIKKRVSSSNSIKHLITVISEKYALVVNSRHKLVTSSPNWQSNLGQSSITLKIIQDEINDEDLVLMLLGSSNESTYLIEITKSTSKLHKIKLSRNKINELTQNISNTLNQKEIASVLDIKPYAIKDAYQLYKDILEPVKHSIDKSKRLLIVQTEVMNAIPWTILPQALPKKEINSALDFSEYREISWFAENKEVIYLPSLSLFSINHSKNSQALIEPAFGMSPYKTESKSEIDESTIIARTAVNLESFSQLWNDLIFQGAMMEEDLEKLPLLPGTQNQINSMLDNLSSKKLFGLKATKDNIISELNKDYGTLAFATHALVSGPFKNNPGLVIRSKISGKYDLLTVSDIIFQEIKADWVLLMACNTASPGVGGIRGIADAFIYAGAKRLLISNWSIEVLASEKFANYVKNSPFNDSFSKQVADAKKKMRSDKNNIIYAHPMFWGAFSIMGHF